MKCISLEQQIQIDLTEFPQKNYLINLEDGETMSFLDRIITAAFFPPHYMRVERIPLVSEANTFLTPQLL